MSGLVWVSSDASRLFRHAFRYSLLHGGQGFVATNLLKSSFVVEVMTKGGKGFWEKLKHSNIVLDVPSRPVSDGRLNAVSTSFRREVRS